MQMKSKAEVEAAIGVANASQGFAASAESVSDAADKVLAACAPLAAYGSVEAIPFITILQLAKQIATIIFGDGEFTWDKLLAVIDLIISILA